jgi:hypothetical protein
MTTKQKGSVAELAIAADLMKKGYVVARPMGDFGDWDLVLERDGSFERIQVKYTTSKDGEYILVRNRCHSVTAGKVQHTRKYNDSVEWIAVYAGDLNICYYVPSSILKGEELRLRLLAPKNGQTEGIRWAGDYREI